MWVSVGLCYHLNEKDFKSYKDDQDNTLIHVEATAEMRKGKLPGWVPFKPKYTVIADFKEENNKYQLLKINSIKEVK
ncbi:MAG: hypothetical protein LBS41_03955 [Streptococcaceae bacterium]|jgi:hypothetical protein|nr:hypothetical protein [Streptococcaceae bacterium]